ncbi:hypothetical protein [Streptomyces sp. A0592]|uniref:hypothetical protein n=1 Tax=Streptomyces sp. A0592 TaxID=2563099 RepID=UPI00109E66DC|nr:hypothetical protein [Streptomyces sp. A0592]THA82765.1 hypothetical protein E6U81_19680 [Streptomyces sp. A0592]
MTGGLCDVPGGSHDGQPRPYPCGWRCTTHAPQARPTTTPTTTISPAVAAAAQRQTHSGPRQVTSALFVDCGDGRETKHGDRAGQIRYTGQPRARYECLACGWQSETITGPTAIRRFLDHIRAAHKAACPAAPSEGAQAA